MTALLPVALSLAVTVTVSGTPDCPTGDAVQAAMAPMLNAANTSIREVRVNVLASSVGVVVVGAQEEVLAQKSLPLSYSCQERAQSAAVFATTWDVAASMSSPLQDVPPAATRPAPPRVDLKAKAAPVAVPDAQLDARWTLRGALGAMGVAGSSFAQGSQGFGLSGELLLRPAPSWGVRTELFRLWPRSLPLGEGEASWNRTGVATGLAGRLPRSWGAWVGDASLLLTYTSVEGQGFAVNGGGGAWVPGGRLGLGVDLAVAAPWSLALELAGLLWAANEEAIADGAGVYGSLPRADMLLRLSLAFEKKLQRL